MNWDLLIRTSIAPYSLNTATTIFPSSDAVTTIYFVVCLVRLLFEGSIYSRVAFISLGASKWCSYYLRVVSIQRNMVYQGRIKPPKAARGHATSRSLYIDGIVLSVTKNNISG